MFKSGAKFGVLTAILFSAFFPLQIAAEFSYPGCPTLDASMFRSVDLMTMPNNGLWEPVKIDFSMDENGVVDVYVLELRDQAKEVGRIQKYDGATEQVSIIMEMVVDPNLATNYNEGINGIALDPEFRQNGWIYLKWTTEGEIFISRFTYLNDNWDWNSEAVIWHTPINDDGFSHTGGGIVFDDFGHMWFSLGDYRRDDEGPANTADVRGKIFRIKPLPVPEGSNNPGIGKSYTIPSGNFSEFWSKKWADAGEPDLAQQYANPSLVLPEMYVMGTRNAYNLTVDRVREWIAWGDCGPDLGQVTEEHNVAAEPGNFGWPFWAGNQYNTNGYGVQNFTRDLNRPVNNAPGNTGVKVLPPPVPGTHSFQQACAMTGPIYRYDPNLDSDIKMPPHFHEKWFFYDFNNSWMDVGVLSEDGKNLLSQQRVTGGGNIFSNVKVVKPLDMQQGPDGALYMDNYGGYANATPSTAVTRIEYIGPPCDVGTDFVVEKVGCMLEGSPSYDPAATRHNPEACGVGTGNPGMSISGRPSVKITAGRVDVRDAGPHVVKIMAADGVLLESHEGEGTASYLISEFGNLSSSRSVCFIQVTTPKGKLSRRMVIFELWN